MIKRKMLYIICCALFALSLMFACTETSAYTYNNKTIQRIDYSDISVYSIYYMDSDSLRRNYVKLSGLQSYYHAVIAIEQKTGKVWIIPEDCLAEPYITDTTFAYISVGVPPSFYKMEHSGKIENEYECYFICSQKELEQEWTHQRFPNTNISVSYH